MLENSRLELEHILEYKARGFWVRSRISEIKQNEKSNAFFYSIAKEQHAKKTIHKIKKHNFDILDQKAILTELQLFYKKLYTTRFKNSNDYTRIEKNSVFEKVLKITNDDRTDMEAEITIKELKDSLDEFENNKTPGCDGLTKEFYATFWNLLGPILLQTVQFCRGKKLLTQSQRRGVISLLHKKGKDPEQIENYRPISLLNVDYKIITKTLANRIQTKISKLVNADQLGFIKQRYIGEAVRKVNDFLEHHENEGINGYILQLDFRKAFDSIEWNFLFEVLTKINIGTEMVEWIKLCYTQIESCVVNGGFSSKWFALEKGLRQGCPLSAYLFLLCVEILANTIRNAPDVKGLIMGTNEQKLSMFADDCTCLLKDKESVTRVIQLIDTFSKYSGLELNHSKCEVYMLRSNEHDNSDTFLPFKQNTENITLLGITMGRKTELNEEKNIIEKQKSIEQKLNRWSQRNLSLIGKILVAKTFGMSKLIHAMSITVVSKQHLRETQKIINKFIWSGKPAKVKHTALINDYDEGGLRAPDVECQYKALKMPWIFRMCKAKDWNAVINTEFNKLGGIQLLLNSNYDKSTIRNLPTFYKEILLYWSEIVNPFGLRQLIVWNNKHIKIANTTIFNSELYSKGVVFLHDFMKNKTTTFTHKEFIKTHNATISAEATTTLSERYNATWSQTMTLSIFLKMIDRYSTLTAQFFLWHPEEELTLAKQKVKYTTLNSYYTSQDFRQHKQCG